ncbi:MAG: hypothetical protein CMJ64_04935 [Planctomycetaceae bacterium]|nr:hypothetical protein [Planctomycetaceae bacterium]
MGKDKPSKAVVHFVQLQESKGPAEEFRLLTIPAVGEYTWRILNQAKWLSKGAKAGVFLQVSGQQDYADIYRKY